MSRHGQVTTDSRYKMDTDSLNGSMKSNSIFKIGSVSVALIIAAVAFVFDSQGIGLIFLGVAFGFFVLSLFLGKGG